MKTNTPTKSYDASDVSEGYALAYEQLADLSVMIDAIRNNHEKRQSM